MVCFDRTEFRLRRSSLLSEDVGWGHRWRARILEGLVTNKSSITLRLKENVVRRTKHYLAHFLTLTKSSDEILYCYCPYLFFNVSFWRKKFTKVCIEISLIFYKRRFVSDRIRQVQFVSNFSRNYLKSKLTSYGVASDSTINAISEILDECGISVEEV